MKRNPAAKTISPALTLLTLGSLSAGAATQTASTIPQRTTSTVRQQLTTTTPTTLVAAQPSSRRGRRWMTVDSNGATTIPTTNSSAPEQIG